MPDRSDSAGTPSRKEAHIELAVGKDVRFRARTTGLEKLRFVHNALPEIDFSDVDSNAGFLGRTLAMPFMVSCMTGGYAGATQINRDLAIVCRETGIALGVGSQRQALENDLYHHSFSVVREAAPDIPVVGNLGAAEVAQLADASPVLRLVELIRADAFTVHLNPLQELLQHEGSPRFRGVLRGIQMLVRALPVPLIVKEIGAGISADVAQRLFDAGVSMIDVAGAGGTSWAGVEALRSEEREFAERFWDWGIPTVEALRQVAACRPAGRDSTIIASGGIVSGTDIAKCIALGADLAGSARPILQALRSGGHEGAIRMILQWKKELAAIMFLTGSKTVADLHRAQLVTEASS
jgi:isopentenyl-diphosphate Delta-isomerase